MKALHPEVQATLRLVDLFAPADRVLILPARGSKRRVIKLPEEVKHEPARQG